MNLENERESERAKRLRARRASTETNTSATATPKKAARQPKLKSITEKESKPNRTQKKRNDDDDTSSVSTEQSLKSMKSCSVVLERLEVDDDEKLLSSVPKTRSRKKSTLTEENVAKFLPGTSSQTRRANSAASEETTSTKPSTLPRRSTRRNSMVATTASAIGSPKRELRTTRATSNSSDDVSVQSRSRRMNSPVEPRTPTASKKKGKSRLIQKLEPSESEEGTSNVKKEVMSPKITAEVEEPQPQPQLLESIAEDVLHTPIGGAFADESVICIVDSDEEDASNESMSKPIDPNATVELLSTVITAIAVTPKEVISLVKNSEQAENSGVSTKPRPSISKWPKSKFGEDVEQPMDLSETDDEENSRNKSGHMFGRIDEIMSSASAALGGADSAQYVATPNMFSADVSSRAMVEPSDTTQEAVILVETVSVPETATPAKTASPLKNTSQLLSATLSSEQAASPKAKPRSLSKSLDTDQDESDQNADEVSEAPSSAEKPPKISPSKVMIAIDESIATSPEEVVSKSPEQAIKTAADTITIAREKTPEPAAIAPSSSLNVAPNESAANEVTPVTLAAPQNVENPIEKEKSPAPSQATSETLAMETDQLINETVENRTTSSTYTVQVVVAKTVVEIPKVAIPAVEEPTATPKPIVEHATQTPTTIVEAHAIQTPITIVEEHATQTSESTESAPALQTPKTTAEAECGGDAATPRPDAQQFCKRQDTPYPGKGDHLNGSMVDSSVIDANETVANKPAVKSDLEEHLSGSRQKLRMLSSSWNESIKRNAIDTPFIDGFGVQNKSVAGAVDAAPPKKFIAARNHSYVSHPDVDSVDEDETEEEQPRNDFVDDEAEVADGYESGDSMDSDERQEIEDNEILEDDISLGSEDTDDDLGDDDEKDSFIADSDEDEYDKLVSKPKRYKRIVMHCSSESDDGDGDGTMNAKNKSLRAAVNGAAAVAVEETATNAMAVEETQTETIVTETNQSIQIVVTDTTTIETSQSTKTSRRLIPVECTNAPNGEFVESEKLNQELVDDKNRDKSGNKSGFEESDCSLPEGAANNLLSSSKKRNKSRLFWEEDTTAENNDALDQSVGKVAAEFAETENVTTPESANEASKETDDAEHEFDDRDGDDDGIRYSLNKSHPKIGQFIALASDRSPSEGAANKSLSSSKKRNVSTPFVEEDATSDNSDATNKSVGKVAAEFAETENVTTPESANEASKESEDAVRESNNADCDGDGDGIRQSLNKSHSKIEQIIALASDRTPSEGAENRSLSSSKKRNKSRLFVEEDATAENNDAVNKSVGKVSEKFVETENVTTPEDASVESKESGDAVRELYYSDEDDDGLHYSLNKSHPEIAQIVASALLNVSCPLLDREITTSSEDEQEGNSNNKTVVDKTSNKSIGEKSSNKVKSVKTQPSSECDVDNIFYSLNEAHPANATVLRMMRASPRNLDTINVQPDQDERIVPTVLNSSTGNGTKANTSLEKPLTPRQGKENVSANQLPVTAKTATNLSLPGDDNTPPALALRTFVKKSSNKSFGEIDTNQSLQVNPLSIYFDANASNLRRSSTPNQKALLKTQAATAQPKPNEANENVKDASNESVPIESKPSSKSSGESIKSPPEANDNKKKKSQKAPSNENPLVTTNFTEILNRCEAELVESKEKKKKQKVEGIEDDERQLEKKERKKWKKAEKLAARAAADEKKRQQLEEVEKAAVERKNQKKVKSTQDDQQPSTNAVLDLASTSSQSTSSGKRSKKKRDDGIGNDHAEQPKAKKPKHLQILTSSGTFDVSPISPPRVQFGFIETPLTPVPLGYKVQPMSKKTAESLNPLKIKKRRLDIVYDEPNTYLFKPRWRVENLFDGFEQTHGKKRQRESSEVHIFNPGPTQFIVKSLEPDGKRRKQPASSLIPVELMEYRKQNLYRKGIPRQDARTLLKSKEKIATSKLF